MEKIVETPAGAVYTRTWDAANPLATLTFVHGLGEHCARYDHVFSKFAASRIKVHSFDQRGFGKTGRKDGNLGDNHGIDKVMEDIKDADKRVRQSGVPHFLMGHSMGGGLVIRYILQSDQTKIAGCIASAPFLGFPEGKQPYLIKEYLVKGLAYFLPTFSILNPVESRMLSRDAAACKAYDEDPDVHPYISFRTAVDITSNAAELSANGWKNFVVPLLITHGTKDELTGIAASKAFVEKANSKDKEFVPFEGWFHELHNEKEYDEIVERYISWILKRAKK